MARFTVDAANDLIQYNRRRISELSVTRGKDPLVDRVARQLELSTRSLERHRDALLVAESRRTC